MAKGTRKCKICGKEYEYCRTETNNKFRWQDVACCPEHATEYFELIAASRAGEAPAKKPKKKKAAHEVVNGEAVAATTDALETEAPHEESYVEEMPFGNW